MNGPEPLPQGRRRSIMVQTILSYLLAAVFLVWVFHGIEFNRLFENVGRITWPLVILGLFLDVVGYTCAGLRWHFLLKPLGRVGVVRTTQAVYAGLFLNEILPMRVGEVARAYIVSRWLNADVLRVVPSMAIERLTEGIWLAVMIGLTAMFVPLPRSLIRSANILAVAVLVGTALFIFYVLWRRNRIFPELTRRSAATTIRLRLRRAVQHLGHGFGEIGLTWDTAVAFGASFLVFAFQALCFWFILRAYQIPLPLWAGAVVFLIIHFGTSLPNAPANVGAYQFFCVLGLQLFSVDKTLATGFSFVVFILVTVPFIGIGFVALAQSGLTMGALRDKMRKTPLR
jgi:uncharacterized protein (TIRG00374 family)